VYGAGKDSPIFQVDGAGFGILICYDSTFPELAASLASRGARDGECCWVVPADVAGTVGGLRSEGTSAITSPAGQTLSSARALSEDLLVAETIICRPTHRPTLRNPL